MILPSLDASREEFATATGWQIKAQGACKADVCVPLTHPGGSGGFDLASTAERLGMAIVHDDVVGLWSLGPESLGNRSLFSAEAPELELADLDGAPFRLSSLRGQKVVIVSWAPY